MKKKFLALLLALAMTLALAACGGGGAAGTIKIGGIGPLTGSTAQYGIATDEGAKIAIEEINALGGLQFELNGQDDEADGEKGVNAYNNLMDYRDGLGDADSLRLHHLRLLRRRGGGELR